MIQILIVSNYFSFKCSLRQTTMVCLIDKSDYRWCPGVRINIINLLSNPFTSVLWICNFWFGDSARRVEHVLGKIKANNGRNNIMCIWYIPLRIEETTYQLFIIYKKKHRQTWFEPCNIPTILIHGENYIKLCRQY